MSFLHQNKPLAFEVGQVDRSLSREGMSRWHREQQALGIDIASHMPAGARV
jgi:hypothetical protein